MNRTLIERLREMAKKENVVLEIVIDGRDDAVIELNPKYTCIIR